jgi:hypothetical protein
VAPEAAGPERPHDVCVGLLEELSPAALVAHGEEGAGGRGPSHGVVVLVRADGLQLKLDLLTPCPQHRRDKRPSEITIAWQLTSTAYPDVLRTLVVVLDTSMAVPELHHTR